MWDVTKDPERPADPLLPNGQPDPRGVQLHSQFWYVASHVVLTLDFNFALRAPSWQPPPPFAGEHPSGGFLLSRVYECEELIGCLTRQRDNAAALMAAVDAGAALPEGRKGFDPITHGLLGNLRHAYVHWGQLAMFLWQHRA